MYKIIGSDEKEYGPITTDQIRRWITEGRVNAQTRVRLDGTQEWTTLGNLPEFGLSFSSASTRPAPSPVPTNPPSAIKIFGVLNIIFGSILLLRTPFLFFVILSASRDFRGSSFQNWWVFSALFNLIGGSLMLASGIGLCNFRSWARKLAIIFAFFACARVLAGALISASHLADNGPMPEARRIGMMFGFAFAVIFGVGYNGLLIYFLNRQNVKDALGETNQQNPVL